jgi:transcriptional regulator with XRE-family HTH domain
MRSSRSQADKSEISIALAQVIRSKREETGLTQEQFAELTGLSKNYIGNLERGEYEISISALVQVANAVDSTASDLLKEAGF